MLTTLHRRVTSATIQQTPSLGSSRAARTLPHPAESFRHRPSDLNQNRNGIEKYRETGFFNNLLVLWGKYLCKYYPHLIAQAADSQLIGRA